MEERKRMGELKLTGGRRVMRSVIGWALPAFALIAAIGYLLPAHRPEGETYFHANMADGGPFNLIELCVAAFLTFLLRKGGYGSGIVAGFLAMAGAFLALVGVFLAHLFTHTETAYGDGVFAVGVLGMFLVGACSVVVDPVVHFLERRVWERAHEPPKLPTARVIT